MRGGRWAGGREGQDYSGAHRAAAGSPLCHQEVLAWQEPLKQFLPLKLGPSSAFKSISWTTSTVLTLMEHRTNQ